MAEIVGVVVSAVACVAQCFSPSVGHRIKCWREFKRNSKILKTKVKTLKAERMSIQHDVDAAKRDGDGIKENVQNWMEKAEEIEVEIQKWLERASKIVGDDQEVGEIRKDEETAAAGEIGGIVEIAPAAAARKIGEGEEKIAAAGEIRAVQEKTAAKKRYFKGLCPNLKLRYQLSKEAETLLEDVVKHLEAGKFYKISGVRIINSLRELKTNFRKLDTRLETLKAERMSLQRDVDKAKRNGDGIRENVQKWLEKAKMLEVATEKWLESASKIIRYDQAAGKIRKDEETAAAGEIGGDAETAAAVAGEIREYIQAAAGEIGEGEETAAAAATGEIREAVEKMKWLHQLSKEAETLLEDVVKLVEEGKFDRISDPVIPKDPRLSNKDYEAFESRTSTLKNIISSLSDPNVNIVGIYGMGGIGKTTLAKEVANQTEASKLFDSVIFVELTVEPDVTKIQQEIAEKFPDPPFSNEETESSRAAKLFRRLENEKNEKNEKKKILLILDNIWVHLNLQAIGIPFGDGLKVLLTARSVDVLSAKMESQRNFPVEPLDDEEAWQLFKKMSRDNTEGSKLPSVAREVAKQCARLPIFIVTVARALRNKQSFEWDDALHQLKAHSSENMQDTLNKIELSYNYLNEEQKKTIMLIRYANLTSIDELLMFGMGLDLFESYPELEGRRKRVQTLVQQLKNSCLLFDGNTINEDFSMHDVVREAVISIASREGHVFTSERPYENTLKVCNSIVLYEGMSGELQQQVSECQQLKLLAIWGARSKQQVSLRFLTNLRALRLYKCRLNDITIIGHLKELEILSLKSSIIRQLPVELGDLPALKSLDLRKTDSTNLFHLIPPNVLSSSSRLEELYMGDFRGWKKEGLNKDINVSLDELKHLSNLTCLQIRIRDAMALPGDLFFNKLERYDIEIGQNPRKLNDDWIHESCRKFSLSLISTNIYLNDGHIMKLKNIEVLSLFGSQDTETVLYGLDIDGFQQLKYLRVVNNDKLLCIVDATKDATNNAFPILESLSIQHVMNLEKICRGQLITGSSFSQLRKIEVGHCAKLEYIFSFSIARRLQLLQSIDISYCENMKEIFAIEREDESNCNISEVIDNIELSQLRSLKLRDLPQLKSLENNSYTSDTLFIGQVVLTSLEVLEINNLNVERIWQNQFAAMSSSIQNLTRLILWACNNLRHVFSSSLIRSFVRLQDLEIWNCSCLEEIVVIDERTDEVFPQLQFLALENLENLSNFCSSDSVELPSLKELYITNCPKFKEFLVKNIGTNLTEISSPFFNEKVVLTSLEVLEIYELNIERIWQNQFAAMSSSIQNLTRLNLRDCDKLRCVFSSSLMRSFVRLQQLEIRDCPCLEEIVVIDERTDVVFPQLQFLKLQNLKNLSKFCSGDSVELPSLKDLDIMNCPKFKEFLVKNIGTNLTEISSPFFNEKVVLSNLEYFELRSTNAESIWPNQFLVPSFGIKSLTKLILKDNNNLRCLFSSSIIRSFDGLQSLQICKCQNLEVLFDLKGPNFEDPQSSPCFQKLKKVFIVQCDSLKHVFPASLVSSLSQLEYLDIISCGVLEDIVFVAKEDSQKCPRFVFPRVISLTLHDLPNLTTFFSSRYTTKWPALKNLDVRNLSLRLESSNESPDQFLVEKVFPKLESLTVQGNFLNRVHSIKRFQIKGGNSGFLSDNEMSADCDYSVNLLIPSLTSFQNLTTLSLYYCHALTNIVTFSTAMSMGQLREMKIIGCHMITELILSDEEDEANDYEIVFRELKELRLQCLQSLVSFCSANYTLKFPSLEKLVVIECPEMKSFSRGNLSTPKLEKVRYDRDWPFEECLNGDLNTTIQQLHEERYKRHRPTMTGTREDVSSSSNNVET